MMARPKKLQPGDKVRIVSDWIQDKELTATVHGITKREVAPSRFIQFVEVRYGDGGEASIKYGVFFPIDEVKRK